MSISNAIDLATRQAITNPQLTCNTCRRSGLPILLLRTAYAPHPRKTQSYRLAVDSEITHLPMRTDQLRTLRQGYVYVLLDQQIWQAYQVTPEGALRQFSPLQPPLAPGKPLPEHCATQCHDVIAAFININTLLYSKAWIAFANDPWPREVLDFYRDGIASNTPDCVGRFVELDLNVARNDPASVGIAMTETDLGLDDVLEYASAYAGKYSSV
ncbi:T6SS effector BTH_I2691 family protein, partial [Pseudomonas sp. NPDC090233]|uniref:T6SS effector BTH_I2691 family protein n=1 Tax=Pseudomonas sp. NPDC090233 TaxID=3364479 RepID=UPI00383BD8FD